MTESTRELRGWSIKELKTAIQHAGLEGKSKGCVEKSDLVSLLSDHLAANPNALAGIREQGHAEAERQKRAERLRDDETKRLDKEKEAKDAKKSRAKSGYSEAERSAAEWSRNQRSEEARTKSTGRHRKRERKSRSRSRSRRRSRSRGDPDEVRCRGYGGSERTEKLPLPSSGRGKEATKPAWMTDASRNADPVFGPRQVSDGDDVAAKQRDRTALPGDGGGGGRKAGEHRQYGHHEERNGRDRYIALSHNQPS